MWQTTKYHDPAYCPLNLYSAMNICCIVQQRQGTKSHTQNARVKGQTVLHFFQTGERWPSALLKDTSAVDRKQTGISQTSQRDLNHNHLVPKPKSLQKSYFKPKVPFAVLGTTIHVLRRQTRKGENESRRIDRYVRTKFALNISPIQLRFITVSSGKILHRGWMKTSQRFQNTKHKWGPFIINSCFCHVMSVVNTQVEPDVTFLTFRRYMLKRGENVKFFQNQKAWRESVTRTEASKGPHAGRLMLGTVSENHKCELCPDE